MAARPVVLGLCSFTHDSSAALVADDVLVGFVEEERLSGLKHTRAFPHNGVEWLLGEAGLDAGDVTDVAYNFAGRQHLHAFRGLPQHLTARATRRRALPRAVSFARVYRRYRQRIAELKTRFPNAAVRGHDHHRSHGLYGFASSGYGDAAVLIVDSLGEIASTSFSAASRNDRQITYGELATISDPASLGYAYGAITEHLGWRRGSEEGTVMALAATGDPSRFRTVLRQAIGFEPGGFDLDPELLPLRVLDHRFRRTTQRFAAATCPPRHPEDPIEQVHADLAAALQERTEELMVHLARHARTLTGSDRLCLAGGVAANCVSVGRIIREGLFNEVHVPPAPGDSGTAIGAAIDAWIDRTGRTPDGIEDRCYPGPRYGSLDQKILDRDDVTAHRPQDLAEAVAQALAEGQIIGVFRGRGEAGPRALGNRSILASPLIDGVVDRLNRTIKFREPFRPFAPIVTAAATTEFFELNQPAPYMSIAAKATPKAHRQIPAVVHTNGTARVQTLTDQQNPFIAAVIDRFAAHTGVPIVINTSLNIKGKPMCGTPEMALDCLTEAGLDALVLEDWWVTRC